MAKNFVEDGDVPTFVAPAGGVVSGGIYAIGTLVMVAITDAVEGAEFAGHLVGCWRVPSAAGLLTGAAVSLKAGGLVAAGTAASVPAGKLIADESGGFAVVRLSN
ncbi:MAG: capsid cement protein [Phyllobacterium sp.]|uniref:capsid cement protein n=1 Tax=Phyllobacterium sp. TaxID=1871046 RepID=UPI0030F1241F